MQETLPRPQLAGARAARVLTALASAAVLLLVWIGSGLLVPAQLTPYGERFRSFVTIFLGIFIEALPFLLAGVLVSSAIHLFVTPERLQRLVPRHPLAGAVAGSLLGLVFPVCECGSIPAARQLLSKGAPLPLGIAFVLASPVVNPIVIISTSVAFVDVLGWSFVAWRVGLSVLVAVLAGVVFGVFVQPQRVLAPSVLLALGEEQPAVAHDHAHGGDGHDHGHGSDGQGALAHVLSHAGAEFFEMSRYLVIGGMLAAGLQTFISPQLLISLGEGPLVSVVVMMLLAVVLSICSTVDSFVALSFVGTFSPGALLAFLVFGPMVDIKSALMYTSTFRRQAVGLMIALIAASVLAATLLINIVSA